MLVPCGHGGYCSKCAHTLLAHRPAARLCPICRAGLSAVVKIHLDTPIGSSTDVLQASSAASAPRPRPQAQGFMALPPESENLPEAASSLPGLVLVPMPSASFSHFERSTELHGGGQATGSVPDTVDAPAAESQVLRQSTHQSTHGVVYTPPRHSWASYPLSSEGLPDMPHEGAMVASGSGHVSGPLSGEGTAAPAASHVADAPAAPDRVAVCFQYSSGLGPHVTVQVLTHELGGQSSSLPQHAQHAARVGAPEAVEVGVVQQGP